MLYKKFNSSEFDPELFRNPTSEFRGAPFWAWNTVLDGEELCRQIDIFKEMGMGGFHIHSRTGMATDYLSDEFMELVRLCNEKAKKEGMLTWLYDEDRWPSGSCGGRVTADFYDYRERRWRITAENEEEFFCRNREEYLRKVKNGEKPRGYLHEKFSVTLSKGRLVEYKRLGAFSQAAGEVFSGSGTQDNSFIIYVFVEIAEDDPWFNNQAYIDTLNPEATEKFIEYTHEKYAAAVGKEFGNSIPAIFTDEPQTVNRTVLSFAEKMDVVTLPFTEKLLEFYKSKYSEDIMDFLPELVWDTEGKEVSVARYRYHDAVSEMFAAAFADMVGKWCDKHNIALTGHMMQEPTLYTQTMSLGEAMRSYRSFRLPGIDILCDSREFTTAKQAQSASRQYGREGVLSELYGVTNWNFDFKGHKLQGDWQAALGVTARVHHLTWVSMEGNAKRDYPACIGYQSPWYKEYKFIEDYFARINTALTRGKAMVKVAVVHPIESYWLYWGPGDKTAGSREQIESAFLNVTEWLIRGLIDFDYIAESLFPDLTPADCTAPLQVGEMAYEAVVVPNCITLRKETYTRLKNFAEAGGKVVFVGRLPEYIDAEYSREVYEFAGRCKCISADKQSLSEALEEERFLSIRKKTGAGVDNMLHQIRDDGDYKWVFIAYCEGKTYLFEQPDSYRISFKGEWTVTQYNALDGSISEIPSEYSGGHTYINRTFYAEDSLLVKLEKGRNKSAGLTEQDFEKEHEKEYELVAQPYDYKLSEPNVLLLDMAEYRFDGSDWEGCEEILRIDDIIRNKSGMPLRSSQVAQPWVDKEDVRDHLLELRYTVMSDIEIAGAELALEEPEHMRIFVNGEILNKEITGAYVDKSIKRIKLPVINKGVNEIKLEISFGRKSNVEALYLLGDFGVDLRGKTHVLKSLPEKLVFGDAVSQLLPFYSGNIEYNCKINVEGDTDLTVHRFAAPLLGVKVDGEEIGNIAFTPHKIDLTSLPCGEHDLTVISYGNRHNTFAGLHNTNKEDRWCGPGYWRTEGYNWSYEYQLKPNGILTAPVLTRIKNPD